MTDIAIVVPSFSGGGAEKILSGLARDFAEIGHRVDVVSVYDKSPDSLKGGTEGIHVVALGKKHAFRAIGALAGYFSERRPRAVLSTLTYLNIVVILSVMLARSATRVVVREATCVREFSLLKAKRRDMLLPFLAAIFYRRADHIIAVSQYVACGLERLRGIEKEKISVIYNPISLDEIERAARQEIDRECLLPGHMRIIVTLGRLSKEKDHDTLIRAFSIVRKTCCNALLIILGEGRERANLTQLVAELELQDYVLLEGHKENPYAYLSKADVFVLSSIVDGLPNALIEAMACGLLVVATESPGGTREILKDGKCGVLVPAENPEELARGILSALEHDKPVSRNAYDLERFSRPRIVDEYLGTLLGRDR